VRWLALLLVTSCWVAPPPPAQPIVIANAMPSRPEPGRFPHHTEWLGHYTCAQGVTALRLAIDIERGREERQATPERIEVHDRGAAVAIFEFGPLDENPGVPRGSYRMTGVVTIAPSGELQVDLTPREWLEQPTGYMMVGLSATSDPQRQTLRGHIDNTSCGTLELTRSD
jgi:hypothetical protein